MNSRVINRYYKLNGFIYKTMMTYHKTRNNETVYYHCALYDVIKRCFFTCKFPEGFEEFSKEITFQEFEETLEDLKVLQELVE